MKRHSDSDLKRLSSSFDEEIEKLSNQKSIKWQFLERIEAEILSQKDNQMTRIAKTIKKVYSIEISPSTIKKFIDSKTQSDSPVENEKKIKKENIKTESTLIKEVDEVVVSSGTNERKKAIF